MYKVREFLRESLYRAFSFPGLPASRREGTAVLMYHEIGGDNVELEAWTVVRQAEFARQMEYLKRNFQVISLEEAVWNFENNKMPARPAAVVTFDDGYAGNYEFALPVMESLSIPITVFVATEAVQQQSLYWYDRLILALHDEKGAQTIMDRLSLRNCGVNNYTGKRKWGEIEKLLNVFKGTGPDERKDILNRLLAETDAEQKQKSRKIAPLSMQSLKELSRSPLVTIGAHTHYHDILPQLAGRDVRETVRKSKELLERWTGREIRFFAYPNGDYNESVIKILREEGFKCGLTTAHRRWSPADSLFEIPRIGIGRYDSLSCFRFKLGKGLPAKGRAGSGRN